MILAYDALLVYLFKNTFDLLSLSSTVVEYLQTFLPTKTERKKVFFQHAVEHGLLYCYGQLYLRKNLQLY